MPLGLPRRFRPNSAPERSGRHVNFHAVVAVARKASQQPEYCTDHQYDLYLCGSEIPAKNIDKRHDTANDAYIEPQHDPVLDSYMNMHITSGII